MKYSQQTSRSLLPSTSLDRSLGQNTEQFHSRYHRSAYQADTSYGTTNGHSAKRCYPILGDRRFQILPAGNAAFGQRNAVRCRDCSKTFASLWICTKILRPRITRGPTIRSKGTARLSLLCSEAMLTNTRTTGTFTFPL